MTLLPRRAPPVPQTTRPPGAGAAAARLGWALLIGAALDCAVLSFRQGGHGVLVDAAVALAAFLSSIAGFAFSAICGAILFHLPDDSVEIVEIMIACSIANQAAMTWTLRRDIDWRRLAIFLAGGALGLPAGVFLLVHADRALFARGLGLFLLAYGGFMLARRPWVIAGRHAALDFVAGCLGGVTGGAVGFPGAFVTIWCGMKGWDKARQRAIVQPFILLMQVAALVAISLSRGAGGAAVGFDPGVLIFVPGSLLGTALGMACYRRLSDIQFARVVNILLIVSGISYVA